MKKRIKELSCVGIIFYDSIGDVLLQQRDYNPHIKFPGCWVLIGGCIEPGEKPLDALARELTEELGIDISDPMLLTQPQLFDIFYFSDDTERHTQYIFKALVSRNLGKLPISEGLQIAFQSKATLPTLNFGFNIKGILLDFWSKVN